MIGQYSDKEMMLMIDACISSAKSLVEGKIVRQVGHTYNYYSREKDGSWTNYDCKTVY